MPESAYRALCCRPWPPGCDGTPTRPQATLFIPRSCCTDLTSTGTATTPKANRNNARAEVPCVVVADARGIPMHSQRLARKEYRLECRHVSEASAFKSRPDVVVVAASSLTPWQGHLTSSRRVRQPSDPTDVGAAEAHAQREAVLSRPHQFKARKGNWPSPCNSQYRCTSATQVQSFSRKCS